MRKYLALAMVLGLGCGPLFGPAEKQAVIDNQIRLDGCEALALACKADGGAPAACYDRYLACLNDAGLQ